MNPVGSGPLNAACAVVEGLAKCAPARGAPKAVGGVAELRVDAE